MTCRRSLVIAVAAVVLGLLGADADARTAPEDAAPETAPPPAPRCAASTRTFSNSTDVTIPAGPSIRSSVITVTGAGPHLFDVDVRMFLQHTYSSDLDVTLTSPAGTVVTLTTDNGAELDDVFNGVTFDDDANPGGQVPYTSNQGLVTDRVYTNGRPAGRITPEEGLGAFVGENPNGTWRLRVSDDSPEDGGVLRGWSLILNTTRATPTPVDSGLLGLATSVTIPTGPGVAASTMAISGPPTFLRDLDVQANIQHSHAADLDVTLRSPSGTVVTLTTDNGSGADDAFLGTRWDDDANPGGQVPYEYNDGLVADSGYASTTAATTLAPEEPLAAFIGENPVGTWRLTISDDEAGDGGALTGWTLFMKLGGSCLRPDGHVARARGNFAGNDVYNATGARQTVRGSARRGRSVTYRIQGQNDSLANDVLRFKGPGSTPSFKVVYRDAANADITSQVVAGTYASPSLGRGQRHAIRMVVTVRRAAAANATLTRRVTVSTQGDPVPKDTVRTITTRAT